MLRQYELVERVKRYDPNADEAMINRAYVFSVQKHGSQKRASGDPYFSHPIEVAGILTDFYMDDATIVTALLHDTIEDTLVTFEEIEQLFGPEIARLVDGVTKLSKIEAQSENERAAENLRKFLLAMSDDIRVLLVKLADRLHNMRTLHFIQNVDKRRRIARETMEIYAPLAERIGMYDFMREMQLLAFQQLEPEAYDSITRRLEQLKEGGGDKVARIASGLQLLLGSAGLKVNVSGREKHPYSIWKKMQERHISFEQLTDVMAFRVIAKDADDCYRALGIIHRKFKMVPGRFKDYISTPKRNGYRSIHTTVIHGENARIEVQIRSAEMHRENEFGLAAHWAYKRDGSAQPDGQAAWLRDLIEILEQSHDAEELLENTRLAMYQDRIFAFTPKGELHQLPKGSTPVDFAYAIHTSLGDQTVGAKVNGRVVPLRTILENGDQVEILKSQGQEPQPSWLAFAITAKARTAIRRYIRHKQRDEMIALGENIFEEIVGRLPVAVGEKAIKAALKRLKLDDRPALMIAIATHRVTDAEVMEALIPGSTTGEGAEDHAPRQHNPVSIRGLTPGIAYKLGDCCHPVPGDRIVGIRRTGEPIEVHTIDCMALESGQDDDWVDLYWDSKSKGGTARLQVVVKNQPGTLAAVSNIFGVNKANILNLQLVNRDGPFHTDIIDLEVADAQHLMRIVSALRALDCVAQADRV
ncbi:RelA/SpoT family protein [Sphingobium subterraneum]|uniref:GTP pyrophosphokinase rsh n=1 Tax=Sphingobium subterraneum TaxID=627688 RepID=A0A841J337_9SPHN|nr:bifunctional (p)ppGpp synthetase/guanosine-3',5'-bis(diphosphate) 3'-pyrophosphohydrolase [Sphingobium subterraneum]MBB6125100.1 GTP pyrophosphokinase [Sphingobium subterraneum]